MEYFYKYQTWLYHTSFYQEILSELPEPLNNLYYDSIVLLFVALYVIYRIVDAVYSSWHRNKMRKRHLKTRQSQKGFYDNQSVERTPETENSKKQIGYRRFFIGGGVVAKLIQKDVNPSFSDYDVMMDEVANDALREKEMKKQQNAKCQQMHEKMNVLNEELRVEPQNDFKNQEKGSADDAELEKRKERARKEVERERQKAERINRKPKGVWYEKFRRKG